MKILHIAPSYFPNLGGVETHIKSINKILTKKDHDVSVLTIQDSDDYPLEENIDNVNIYRIKINNKYQNKLLYKLNIWKEILKKHKIFTNTDIVHIHDVYWWILPILPLIISKSYITFHGWEGIFPIPWKNKVARLFWSILARKSIHVGHYISRFYYDKPDLVIYGGTNLGEIKPTKNNFNNNTFNDINNPKSKKTIKIYFIGRLEKENDIQKYISLAKKLKSDLLMEKSIKIDITWIGDGKYKNECKKHGKVTGMIKDPILQIIDADFIWAASYLSIIDAQAMGKIVCAFYSHELKESYLKLYPGAKYMLIGSKTDIMAQKMMHLFSDNKEFYKYSKKSYEFAEKQTWEKIVDKYLTTFSSSS